MKGSARVTENQRDGEIEAILRALTAPNPWYPVPMPRRPRGSSSWRWTATWRAF